MRGRGGRSRIKIGRGDTASPGVTIEAGPCFRSVGRAGGCRRRPVAEGWVARDGRDSRAGGRLGIRAARAARLVAVGFVLAWVLVLSGGERAGASSFSFGSAVSTPLGAQSRAVSVGRINTDPSDHREIMVVADGAAVSVMLADSNGALGPPTTLAVPNVAAPGVTDALAIVDVNGDGHNDIVVGSGSTTISVFPGRGDGTFGPPITSPAPYTNNVTFLAVGDIDGDGKPDLVTADGYPPGADPTKVSTFHGNGDGTFTHIADYAVGNTYQGESIVRLADFNGDGKLDIAAASTGCGYGGSQVTVMLNDGTGKFPSQSVLPGDGCIFGMTIADVNGDGKRDIVTTNHAGVFDNTSTINVALSNGDGTFQPLRSSPTPPEAGAITIADFNGNGTLDAAVASGSGDVAAGTSGHGPEIAVLPGNGDGTFGTAETFCVSSDPGEVTYGNLSGNGGPPDIVTNDDSEVSVLPNGGGGSGCGGGSSGGSGGGGGGVGRSGAGGGTTSPPAPGVRPIIFIPGITGSFLEDPAGNETWPNAAGLEYCLLQAASHLFQPFVQTSCDLQALGANALASDGTGSAVDAANGMERPLDGAMGGAIDSYQAPLRPVTHIYDVTAQNLENSGYVKVQPAGDPGLRACAATWKCFIPVGVDWRKSANFNAARILSEIDQVLQVTGADRVDIMAHSQGGLITNALLHMPGSVGKVYRVVTFGTPWLGSPKFLAVLLFREPCLAKIGGPVCGLNQDVAQDLVKNMPGGAELTPSKAYYDATAYSPLLHVVNGNRVSMSFKEAYRTIRSKLAASPLNRDTTLIDSALAFHDVVDRWNPLDPSVKLVRMIGYDASSADPQNPCTGAPCPASGAGVFVPPTQAGTDAATITAMDSDSGDLFYGTGDGTVPLNSANLYDPARNFDFRGRARDLYFCGLSHGGLPQATLVWEWAQPFLEGWANYLNDQVALGCPDGTDGTLQGVDLGSSSSPASAEPGSLINVTGAGFAAQTAVNMTLVRQVGIPGSLIDTTGAGFTAQAAVNLTLRSSSIPIGGLTADARGRVSGVVGIPRGIPIGQDVLVARGIGPGGRKRTLTRRLRIIAFRIRLPSKASISGGAFAASSIRPLVRICVRAYQLRPGGRKRQRLVAAGQALTASSGQFRIAGLNPGTYKVSFTDCGHRGYKTVWYRDASTSAKATALRLVRGGTRVDMDGAMRRRRR
jgi:FG-GAP-like repeat/Lecithin:cholesterol acyltransferase